MGEAAKALLFEGVKAGCDVYCVAGVALPGILTCLQECRKSFSVTGALLWHGFHEDELHFSWQVLHFGDLNRHFAWQTQRFRRVVLLFFGESHCHGCVKWCQCANSVAGMGRCESVILRGTTCNIW